MNKSKIAIIGGGFTGLACAVKLVDSGTKVVVMERSSNLGGLAGSVKQKDWEWPLEGFYHHIFSNDEDIISIATEIGCPPNFSRPLTSSFIGGIEAQLDSPVSLLKFKQLSFLSRIHTGMGIALLKFGPNGNFWEKVRVVDWLPIIVGKESYEKIWERLLKAKFGKYLPKVNMGWFWARIVKRTANLGYFEGGFQKLIEAMRSFIEDRGGEVRINCGVEKVKKDKEGGFLINDEHFDRVVITVPGPIANEIVGENLSRSSALNYLSGQTLILELKKSLLNCYWLNILERDWPFLVAVEHTHFVDKKHYGNKYIVYLGNYLEEDDKRLKMDEDELIELYLPFIKKINNKFDKRWIEGATKCQMPYAQPVFPINYSRQITKIKTNIPGLYLANMSMVYPWDRGTNYAIKMGVEVAKLIKTSF